MPRTTALLNSHKQLAPLQPAATILLLRDSAQGLQVLMTQRSMDASFAPGAYVFPGGGVESADEENAQKSHLALENTASNATDLVAFRADQSLEHATWALTAIRESFEEVGILLARQANAQMVSQSQVDALDRTADFYEQITSHGFQLAANEVYLLARWLTDRDLPKRFDVPFLVARMPAGQTPVADENEQFSPEWISPQEALRRHEAGLFAMIFPTVRTLQRLSMYAKTDDVLLACASGKPLWTSCPRAGLIDGKEVRLMEHESAYGELAMVSPYGQMTHELAWQTLKPVRLLKHVMRLTAPNPGAMTGPGTNTYIVGTASKGYIVIDPGPNIESHIKRIIAATDGDIVAIVCTHSHADHSPAATPLQAMVAEASHTTPMMLNQNFAPRICPILGIPSAATAHESAWFQPNVALKNNSSLASYFRLPYDESPFHISLQAIHTHGHAANHLCLILPEDGLLFSGDHVLNGSTTAIDPPDGNMTDYLASLDRLAALCQQHDLRFILPAHGHVLSHCDARQISGDESKDANRDAAGGAASAIASLKIHRLKREAKVIAAMKRAPTADAKALLPIVYNDVKADLWPVAERSLTAHMERIQALGLA